MKRIVLIVIIAMASLLGVLAQQVPDSVVQFTTDTIAETNTAETPEKSTNSVEEQLKQTPTEVLEAISFSKIFWTLILLAIGYFVIKLIIKLLELLAERSSARQWSWHTARFDRGWSSP